MMEEWELISKTDCWVTYRNKNTGHIREHYNYGDIVFYNEKMIFHRLDGPAEIRRDGSCSWYYNGTKLDCSSQEEFEKLLKLKAFW